MMRTIETVSVRIIWAGDVPGPQSPHLLRGALGDRFRDNPLFHQHTEAGVVYRYPAVQYRWDRRGPVILGIGEGARALADCEWAGMELRIGGRPLRIGEAVCEFRTHSIALADRLIRYRLVSPWVPFNQELIRPYRELPPSAQASERDRLAVAGLLLGLRGFGVEVQGRVFAAFEMKSSQPCLYKDVRLLGFRGRLLTNLELPDGFAIGRAVSRGYGWIEREHQTPAGVSHNALARTPADRRAAK